jgi:hypothetical protein
MTEHSYNKVAEHDYGQAKGGWEERGVYPSKVYIMIDCDNGRKVVEAFDYQSECFYDFLSLLEIDKERNEMNYIVGKDNDISFTIKKFDYLASGLSGEYNDVYSFIKEDGTRFLMSCNFKKLSALCGFLNRVIEYC